MYYFHLSLSIFFRVDIYYYLWNFLEVLITFAFNFFIILSQNFLTFTKYFYDDALAVAIPLFSLPAVRVQVIYQFVWVYKQ